MHDLPGFQRECIVAIAGLNEAKVLAIKDELNEYYASEINHGRLNPNLDELVSAGYVEKGQIDDRTNSYSLTDEGRELLEERLDWKDQYVDQ